MKREFLKKVYNIPESWDDVSVDMVIKAQELSELMDEAPLIAIIHCYTGIPLKELKASNVKDVNDILETMAFIRKPYQPKASTSFEFDGSEYGCEEDLVNQKFEDWVSIQTTLYNFREEQYKALPKLLAILCKKKGEVLDDIDLEERTNLFRQLPITKAKNIEGFFLQKQEEYKVITQLYSIIKEGENIVLDKLEELKNTLKQRKAQTGIFSSTRLVIGIYQIYLKLVKKLLVKYYNSEHIKPLRITWRQTFRKLLTKRLRGNKSYIKKTIT